MIRNGLIAKSTVKSHFIKLYYISNFIIVVLYYRIYKMQEINIPSI